MDVPEVVVVGAGPAGLGCAGELSRASVRAVVLEEGDRVGASWRTRYDRLRLNTSRWLSRPPGYHFRRGTPLFPSRDEFVGGLEDYARRRDLDVRTGVHVERLDRDAGAWIVRTPGADVRARNVVVATGMAHEPVLPAWPGRSRLRGRLLHSSAYRNGEPFARESVLVVGAGSSGMEIAHDLVAAGVRPVRLSIRTPPNILLRSIGGLPGDPVGMLLFRWPPRLADAFMAVVRRLSVGDLDRYGLRRPAVGPFGRLRQDGAAPAVVDREVLDEIRSGRIEVVRAVESLDEDGARLADGRHVDASVVVAATGYRTGLEPMVGHLGVLDERGRPRRPAGTEAAPGLRFAAFRPVPALIGDAGRQARRIAREIAASRRRP